MDDIRCRLGLPVGGAQAADSSSADEESGDENASESDEDPRPHANRNSQLARRNPSLAPQSTAVTSQNRTGPPLTSALVHAASLVSSRRPTQSRSLNARRVQVYDPKRHEHFDYDVSSNSLVYSSAG